MKDKFILKNCFDISDEVVRTEDLVSGPTQNKENSRKKRRSARKRKQNMEEIAKSNKTIASFFKKKSAKKTHTKRPKKGEIIDCEEEQPSKNKIIEEIQDEASDKEIQQEIPTQNAPIKPRKRNARVQKEENYEPPKLAILQGTPNVPKRRRSASKRKLSASDGKSSIPKRQSNPKRESKPSKIFNLPKKEDFVWREKLFVITGKLETTDERKEMETFLSFWGMNRRTSVSRKTNLLIHGQVLEDGRRVEQSNKFKKAQKFASVQIVPEEALDRVFKDFTGFSLQINFDKFNEDVDNYPQNLFQEEQEDEVEFELEKEEKNGNSLIVGKAPNFGFS